MYPSEKVASESIYGMRHHVWDVYASDGRWWVITNATNLYPHDETPVTPSMDRALALHIGITARVLAGESRLAAVGEETPQRPKCLGEADRTRPCARRPQRAIPVVS